MKRLLVKVLVGALLLVILLTISYAGFILANFNGMFPYTYYRKEGDFFPTGKMQNFHFDKIKTKMTPIEFLDSLEYKVGGPTYCRVWDWAYDWVKRPDLKILASRLASEKPCVNLLDMISSKPVDKPTTEGEQAFLLISSYLTGSFPLNWYDSSKVKQCLIKEKVPFPPFEKWCVNKQYFQHHVH